MGFDLKVITYIEVVSCLFWSILPPIICLKTLLTNRRAEKTIVIRVMTSLLKDSTQKQTSLRVSEQQSRNNICQSIKCKLKI